MFAKSFRFKLISATMLFIVFGIALSIWITTVLFTRNMESRNEKQALLACGESEKNIVELLTDATVIISSLQNLDAVSDYLLFDPADERANVLSRVDMTNSITGTVNSTSPVSSIFFCGESGRMAGFSAKNRFFTENGDYPYFEDLDAANYENGYSFKWIDSVDLSSFIPSQLPAQYIRNRKMAGGLRQYTYYDYRSNQAVPVTVFFEINPSMLLRCFSYLGNDGSEVYLINSVGEIICSNTSNSGKLSCCENRDLSKQDNFDYISSSNMSYQVITYPLTATNWSLVKCVPRKLYTANINTIWKSAFVSGSIILIAMIILYSIWVQRFSRPINRLVDSIHLAQEGHLDTRASTEQCNSTEMLVVTKAFNEMLDSIELLMTQKEADERELMALEIKTLQAQITPHFIYNTLTSIRWMAIGNGDESTANALLIFSNIIHPIFSSWQRDWHLSDEFDFIENYIKLMRMRFGNKVAICTVMEEKIKNCRIPRFALQTLLENCCEHGTNNDRVLHIQLSSELVCEKIHICVRDDGLGIPDEKLTELRKMMNGEIESKSIGLVNLNRRLHLYFFDDCEIRIENAPEGGTAVTICMPQRF